MPTLTKRSNSHQLDWTDAQGTRHRRSLGQIPDLEAQAKLKELELALLTGRQISTTAPSLRQYVTEIYLPWYKMKNPSSYERVEAIFRRHLLPRFGHRTLDAITSDMTEAYVPFRLAQSFKGKPTRLPTILKEITQLNAVLNRAVRKGVIQKNVAADAELPTDTVDKEIVWYRPAELDRLYAAETQEALRWSWQLYANTGPRKVEGLKAMKSDVDRERRVLKIESHEGAATKTRTWRPVPMNDAALEAYDNLVRLNPHGRTIMPAIRPESLWRAYKRTAARAGLPGTVHSLRHTFGSNLVRAGVPLRTVQALMGHANIQTTMIYSHLDDSDLQDAVASLGRFMAQPAAQPDVSD